MEADNSLIATIRDELKLVQRVLIISHIRPDGDAIGSLIGLGKALMDAGKQVEMVISDGVPTNFRFLSGSELVHKKPHGEFDYRIVVDASEVPRVGSALDRQPGVDLNIDHHITNTNFGRNNLVLTDAAATAEILARYIPSLLSITISPDVANALLTGMITDTIGFRTGSVTPGVLRVAAMLLEHGADLSQVYYKGLVQHPFPAIRYWGAGLGRMQSEPGIVWTTLSLKDRAAVGYGGRDDADLINVLSSIENMDIALIFIEQPSGRVKISWRVCGQSNVDTDVSQIAQQFGGGGHRAAAGAEVDGGIEEVEKNVLNATRSYLSVMLGEPVSLEH